MARKKQGVAVDRDALMGELCRRVALGELTSDVCVSLGIDRSTAWRWCEDDERLRNAYARAREGQAHSFVEMAMRAANGTDGLNEIVERLLDMEANRIEDLPEKDKAAAWSVLNSLRHGAIQRDKLRVDTLKWTASKLAPRDYGDRQAVEHSGGVTVRIETVDEDA